MGRIETCLDGPKGLIGEEDHDEIGAAEAKGDGGLREEKTEGSLRPSLKKAPTSAASSTNPRGGRKGSADTVCMAVGMNVGPDRKATDTGDKNSAFSHVGRITRFNGRGGRRNNPAPRPGDSSTISSRILPSAPAARLLAWDRRRARRGRAPCHREGMQLCSQAIRRASCSPAGGTQGVQRD